MTRRQSTTTHRLHALLALSSAVLVLAACTANERVAVGNGEIAADKIAAAPPPPAESVLVTGSLIDPRTAQRVQGAPAVSPPYGLAQGPYAVQALQAENTERYPGATPNPVKITTREPVSTFSVDVDTASYGNLRRYLKDGALPPSDAVRVEEMINYFDYGYALPRNRTEPFRPTVAVYPSPWNADTQILHIGIKGYDVPKAARPDANLVFLIDTSGSIDRPPLGGPV